MKNKIQKLIIATAFIAVCSNFSVASAKNTEYLHNCIVGSCTFNQSIEPKGIDNNKIGIDSFDYMSRLDNNIHYSILGGGSDSIWQMKTYYEMITLNATQIKVLNNELEKMRMMIEQIKRLPEDVIRQELGQYTGMISEMVAIQNELKDLLKDARDFETYTTAIYNDVKNMDYVALLDRYANTINDLSYNAMRSSNYYSNSVSKNVSNNAKYLMQQAKTGENPIQLLETLNSWNANLSYQITAVSDLINNSNRLQIIEYQEKANKIKLDREQQMKMENLLNQRINEMKSRSKKK